jgi:hypothetical protein
MSSGPMSTGGATAATGGSLQGTATGSPAAVRSPGNKGPAGVDLMALMQL